MRSSKLILFLVILVQTLEVESADRKEITTSEEVRSISKSALYAIHFEEKVRFKTLNEDLARTCRVSGSVRGCTEFPAEWLEYSCHREPSGWRLHLTAWVDTLIHVDHLRILVHERQHLLHLDELLRSYLDRMTAPVFASEARCDALGRVLSRPAYVTSMMNELRTRSNEMFQCDRPGSNHPPGLVALGEVPVTPGTGTTAR